MLAHVAVKVHDAQEPVIATGFAITLADRLHHRVDERVTLGAASFLSSFSVTLAFALTLSVTLAFSLTLAFSVTVAFLSASSWTLALAWAPLACGSTGVTLLARGSLSLSAALITVRDSD